MRIISELLNEILNTKFEVALKTDKEELLKGLFPGDKLTGIVVGKNGPVDLIEINGQVVKAKSNVFLKTGTKVKLQVVDLGSPIRLKLLDESSTHEYLLKDIQKNYLGLKASELKSNSSLNNLEQALDLLKNIHLDKELTHTFKELHFVKSILDLFNIEDIKEFGSELEIPGLKNQIKALFSLDITRLNQLFEKLKQDINSNSYTKLANIKRLKINKNIADDIINNIEPKTSKTRILINTKKDNSNYLVNLKDLDKLANKLDKSTFIETFKDKQPTSKHRIINSEKYIDKLNKENNNNKSSTKLLNNQKNSIKNTNIADRNIYLHSKNTRKTNKNLINNKLLKNNYEKNYTENIDNKINNTNSSIKNIINDASKEQNNITIYKDIQNLRENIKENYTIDIKKTENKNIKFNKLQNNKEIKNLKFKSDKSYSTTKKPNISKNYLESSKHNNIDPQNTITNEYFIDTQNIKDINQESHLSISQNIETLSNHFKILTNLLIQLNQTGIPFLLIPLWFNKSEGFGHLAYWKDDESNTEKTEDIQHLFFDLTLKKLGNIKIHVFIKSNTNLELIMWAPKPTLDIFRKEGLSLQRSLNNQGFNIMGFELWDIKDIEGTGAPFIEDLNNKESGFHKVT